MAKRLASVEASIRELQHEYDALTTRAGQTEKRSIELRAENLGLSMRSRPLDRRRINAALRELLSSVTVNYKNGLLEFEWRAGGESSLMFEWPRDDGKGQRLLPSP